MAINGMGRFGVRSYLAPSTPTYPTSLKLFIDAGNPLSYSGSGTTVTDLSGLGNNATLVNGTSYSSANGGVFVFDGINDYISTSIKSTVTEMSGVCWVKMTNAALHQYFLVDSGAGYISFYTNGSKVVWANYGSTQAVGTTNLSNNIWYCLGFTFKSGELSNVYLNGVLDGSSSSNSGNIQNNGTNLAIGTNSAFYLNGSIGMFQLYTTKLTGGEMLNIFNNQKSRYGH